MFHILVCDRGDSSLECFNRTTHALLSFVSGNINTLYHVK